MSYPHYIVCTLNEVNGTTCQSPAPNQRLEWVNGADPAKYVEIDGQGDFETAILLKSVDDNGNTTWTLSIWYGKRVPCGGSHELIRATAADDPIGDFYGNDGGLPDGDLAKATCVADD